VLVVSTHIADLPVVHISRWARRQPSALLCCESGAAVTQIAPLHVLS